MRKSQKRSLPFPASLEKAVERPGGPRGRRTHFSRLLLCAGLAVGLGACAARPALRGEGPAAPVEASASAVAANAGAQRVRTELYFGLSRPEGGRVSEEEWRTFLDGQITPAFPEGLTVVAAQGQWREAAGGVAKEQTKLLILIHEDTPVRRAALERIVAEYKRRFRQESVLRVTQRVSAEF